MTKKKEKQIAEVTIKKSFGHRKKTPYADTYGCIEFEGEELYEKVQRMLNAEEPIEDTAQVIYTEYAEGVRPDTDIRTDKMEVAMEAMDRVHKTNIAKTKKFLEEQQAAAIEGQESTGEKPTTEVNTKEVTEKQRLS